MIRALNCMDIACSGPGGAISSFTKDSHEKGQRIVAVGAFARRRWRGAALSGEAPREQSVTAGQGQAPALNLRARDIFLAFTQISLSGFGGVLFWSRHVLVERRRWITDREFVETLAMAQLIPGPNVFNLSLMFGYRHAGLAGVFAAIAGFMGWPFLIVIGLGMLYSRYQSLPLAQHALVGMSAAAVGLLIANAVRMAAVLPRHWRPWLFLFAAFVGVGVMRWPLVGVLAVLAPLAVAGAWRENRQ